MLALELEVLSRKLDRFGWERDRGSAAQDRIITDWMDALQDYPLAEVQAACRAAVRANPNKLPNEGHILAQIDAARRVAVMKRGVRSLPEPERVRVSPERRQQILAEVEAAAQRMTGAAE